MPKDITKIKQIRLVTSDFNNVNDIDKTRQQYISGITCPIANSLTRQGFKDFYVISDRVLSHTHLGKTLLKISGTWVKVREASIKISKGAKYAIIKVVE